MPVLEAAVLQAAFKNFHRITDLIKSLLWFIVGDNIVMVMVAFILIYTVLFTFNLWVTPKFVLSYNKIVVFNCFNRKYVSILNV